MVPKVILGWRCPVCGASGAVPCDQCRASMRSPGELPRIEGVDEAAALLEYCGAARELVARIKYRNDRAAIGWLAEGMAGLVGAAADCVTWAPANRSHLRARGFDHGRLLAEALACRLGARTAALLRRGDDAPLTGRTAHERASSLVLSASAGVPGSVLVVDDVITSGATLRAAAGALRARGALSVRAIAAAYTPPPGSGPSTR